MAASSDRFRLLHTVIGWIAAGLLLAGCGQAEARAAPVRLQERIAAPGAQLYLLTRGEDPTAPVRVWLHGGPGGAERPLFRLYNADLEKHFLVAYLDQRGAGRSYEPAADPRQLTIARHLSDLDLVVDHLRRRHGRRKVILIGHSWGAALGLLYTHQQPEKVAAFVGVALPVNELQRQAAQAEFVRAEALRRGEREVLERLDRIGPPPFSASREIAVQRLVERYGGYFRKPQNAPLLLARSILGGHLWPWELGRVLRANAVSLEAMNDELLRLDLARSVPAVSAPVVFMLGRHDRQVDSRLAEAYFHKLSAPAKRLLWFEHSAHNVPFEEPARFNAAVPRALAELGVLTAAGAQPAAAGEQGPASPPPKDR